MKSKTKVCVLHYETSISIIEGLQKLCLNHLFEKLLQMYKKL